MAALSESINLRVDLASIERAALAEIDEELVDEGARIYLRQTAMIGLFEHVYGKLDLSDNTQCARVSNAIRKLYDDHIQWIAEERAKSGAARFYFDSLRDLSSMGSCAVGLLVGAE